MARRVLRELLNSQNIDGRSLHARSGYGVRGARLCQGSVLGVVQGITELLPISSTAHMRLVPAVLGWQDPGSACSAAMQLAALAAVVSYFWSDVHGLAANSVKAIARGQFHDRDLRFSLWIILATIPIGIAGLLLAQLLNTCNSPLRDVGVIGWACVAMALLLGFAEIRARHRRTIEDASLSMRCS